MTTPKPARAPAIRRAALRAAFSWDTSTRPWLANGRCWWDGEIRKGRAGMDPPAPLGHRETPGRLATVAYTGLGEGPRYVLDFLRQQGLEVTDGSATAPADIVVTGTTARRICIPAPGGAALVLPFRVQLVVPVGDADAVHRRISKRERRAFTANRRAHRWDWEHTDDPQAFDHFYERMHLPTMRRRHGEQTRSLPPETAYECLFRDGRLFFVTEGGIRVGGVLCGWDRRLRTLSMRLLGVLDGAERHYTNGTVKALTHFTLEWAGANGVANVDLSGCEPFLSKGIFQFKQRFHPSVALPSNHFGGKRLELRVTHDTEGVRDFLAANPVIALTDGGLEALYFHDEARPPRVDLAWQCPGILRARRIHLDGFLSATPRGGLS